jgi:hypothetical protein
MHRRSGPGTHLTAQRRPTRARRLTFAKHEGRARLAADVRLLGVRLRTATPVIAAILWSLGYSPVLAQSKQEGERLLRDQEQRLGISCRALHPKAHEFVKSQVVPLANRPTAAAALEQRFVDMMKDAGEFADQTHKCYGLEPIALHSRLSFPVASCTKCYGMPQNS